MLLHVLDIKAMVIYRTVLHDLSVLAIRRTIQINSRPTYGNYYRPIRPIGSKVAICVGDEFHQYESFG